MSFHTAKRFVSCFVLRQCCTASHSLNIAKISSIPTILYSHNHPKIILLTKEDTSSLKSSSNLVISLLKSSSTSVNQQRREFHSSGPYSDDVSTAASHIDSASIKSGRLVLSLDNGEKEIPLVWLRDHCHCLLCFNQETNQKKVDSKLLELDLCTAKVDLNDGKSSLTISWTDGHTSTFTRKEIEKWFCQGQYRHGPEPFLWSKASLARKGVPSVSFQEHMTSELGLRKTISNLARYGFTFVDESPASVDGTKKVSERVGRLMPTIYSEGMWTLTSTKQTYADTAYSNVAIGAHTDLTYYMAAAGIQVFHCLEHQGNGGDTLLVDGFHAASILREKHPESFDCLTKRVIPHEYKEAKTETSPGYHLYNLCTILTTWPGSQELIQFRFNPYDRAPLNTLPVDQIPEFYTAYDRLSCIVQDPANEFWIKLTPGRVLFIDNWRVMHGRASFNGLRTLCGCYLQRDEWVSKARVMNVF